MSNNAVTPEQRFRQKELFTILMATMSCMRMTLIHPLLPGGREFTINFSPSRRHLVTKLAKEISRNCVCCQRFPSQIKEKNEDKNARKDIVTEEDAAELSNFAAATDDEQLQDADFDAGNQGGKKDTSKKKLRKKDLGELVPLDSDICHATEECRHYIHEECLKQLQEDSEDELKCPRCKDLQCRLRVDEARSSEIPHETYCEHISFGPHVRGIKATAKIEEIVKWAQDLPEGDKAIAYSFFKGGLDILEGIFVEHLGECLSFFIV